MTAATDDIALQATGQFREWMIRLDLLTVWEEAAKLPTKRRDMYAATLLKIYTTERRKYERSQRFQLSRLP